MKGTCLCCKTEFDYSPSQKRGKYCNNKCQQMYQHQLKVSAWLNEGKVPGIKVIRRYLLEQNNCCSECGITEWNGKPIVLEVDHIDGHHYNNNISNLRLLCPNCHSQTPTYKSKNNGNGRPNRYALVAQLVERGFCKADVASSSLVGGS